MDEIDETKDRFRIVFDKLEELSDEALALLPLLLAAVAVVAVFVLVSWLVTRRPFLFQWIQNKFLADLVRQLVRVGIIAVGVLIALELLDATALVGATLGAAGVFGIAVGFAFKDLVENYIAGLLLSIRNPFAPNDTVVIDGDEGKVVRLTSRATILLTWEGNHLRIPNAKVFKAVILNYTRNPLRRFDFVIQVGVGEDLVAAQDLGCEVLTNMESVLPDPAPFALVTELGDSSVALQFYAWVDQRDHDFFKTKSSAIRLAKTAFDEAGIEMPEPIYRVITEKAGPPRPQVERGENADAEGDTSVDSHLDSQVRAERAEEGPDLLDESRDPE